MFICEISLFDWYFPQFCTSDMSKYGYLEVFQPEGPFDFEITRVDCILTFGVCTEKPCTKPLERNVDYIPITTSCHATSVTSK